MSSIREQPDSAADVLAIGAHPDDVEIACAGAVLRVTRGGGVAAVVDLSAGERATRGTAEQRLREAAEAAEILGVSSRENLGLPDGAIADDLESRRKLASVIRRLRPRVLIAPHPRDDHPDHAAGGRLAEAANFLAGVGGFDAEGERHRARVLLFYMMHHRFEPSLILDVSDVYEEKIRALRCFRSQLHDPGVSGLETNVGAPDFLERLEARHRFFGELIGARYGEAYASPRPPGLEDPRSLLG